MDQPPIEWRTMRNQASTALPHLLQLPAMLHSQPKLPTGGREGGVVCSTHTNRPAESKSKSTSQSSTLTLWPPAPWAFPPRPRPLPARCSSLSAPSSSWPAAATGTTAGRRTRLVLRRASHDETCSSSSSAAVWRKARSWRAFRWSGGDGGAPKRRGQAGENVDKTAVLACWREIKVNGNKKNADSAWRETQGGVARRRRVGLATGCLGVSRSKETLTLLGNEWWAAICVGLAVA